MVFFLNITKNVFIYLCFLNNFRFKNGLPLVDDPKIKLDSKKSIHILTIDSAALEDSAVFTLKAKNDSGEASESFNLVIQSIIFLNNNLIRHNCEFLFLNSFAIFNKTVGEQSRI